jgi:hypothetical protein
LYGLTQIGSGKEPHSSVEVEQRRKVVAGCSWSIVLAVATATAILMSGLNGLVQIVRVVVESGVLRG